MSLLNIILILLYLIWSYRVVFKLKWNDYDNIEERTVWGVITVVIILLTLICVLITLKENGYLDFLTKPLW